MRTRRAACAALALLPAGLGAQAVTGDGAARAVQLVVDNDLFALRGRGLPPDHDYTHGTRATVAWAGPRRSAGARTTAPGCRSPAARRGGCRTVALTVGQEIYTPRRDAPAPVPGERPYAGWLHVTGSTTVVRLGRARALHATVGVTGPASLARGVQDGVHRLMHNEPQLGWAHQLGPALGVEVGYAEVRRGERSLGAAGMAAVRGRWGASAGTLRSRLTAGADAVLGLRGTAPWSPAEPEVDRPPRASLLVGVRQDWVLHDAFVDGRGLAGRSRPGAAARRPLVPQAEVGAAYRWRRVSVEYRHVVRGREYHAQPAPHAFGSVRLTIVR